MMNVGIIGISGYTGLACLELLLKHPNVRVNYVSANTTEGKLSDIWPQLNGQTELVCKKTNIATAIEKCDLIFLAVPHTESMEITPKLIKAKKIVIDLSGDYRLNDTKVYEKWYGKSHEDKRNLKKAVYGLPEIYRVDIKKAKLIANPGCYPTAAILALAPIVSIHGDLITSIIIDAKSGVSGAGRKLQTNLLFTEVNENFRAYKVLKHQHTPEISLYLNKLAQKKLELNFVPHLLPITRGIHETIYITLNKKISIDNLFKIYNNFYKIEKFVRILKHGEQPEIKNVVKTNFCDIGLEISENQKLLVVTSVIDNLIKGATGQAVQNMNIICSFKEDEGLI